MAGGDVRTKLEVTTYILDVRAKLMMDPLNNLYILPREKNQECMTELGLRHYDVANILLKLEEKHYSETIRSIDFPGEWLWIFLYQYFEHELYIKINLRDKVICVSFHE